MKYRTRDEIIIEMLRLASHEKGIAKTHIMYRLILHHYQLNRYLEYLIDKRLIYFDKKSQRYGITREGVEYLEKNTQFKDHDIEYYER
jgi:predicted transcriptional regulator